MRWNYTRGDAAKFANEAVAKEPEKIVEDLYADFYNQEVPTIDGHKTTLIISHHAALPASISKRDAETAQRNLETQNKLILLTKWLLGFTAIFLFIALVQVFMMLKLP